MNPSNQTSSLSGARRSLRITSRSATSRSDFGQHSIQSSSDVSCGDLGRYMYNRFVTPHVLCSTCQNLVNGSKILQSIPRQRGGDYEQFPHHSILEIKNIASLKSCHLCTIIWGSLREREYKFGNVSNNRLSRCRLIIEICTLELYTSYMMMDGSTLLRVFQGRYKKKGQPNFKEGTLIASLSLTMNRSTSKNEFNGKSGWPVPDIPAQFAVYTSSDSTFELGKRWLNRCLADHEICRELRTHERRLPTRLIEIGMQQNQITASLRLSEELTKDVVYMTLSHCWGTIPTLTLTANSYGVLRSGLSLGLLSKTFRDAIIISYRLGCNYLWIDSLCIYFDRPRMKYRRILRVGPLFSKRLHFALKEFFN